MLDYEWNDSCITDDDTQFFDGFHLDEKYGLPDWTEELFTDIFECGISEISMEIPNIQAITLDDNIKNIQKYLYEMEL